MKATVRILIADGTPDSSGNIVRAEGISLPEGEVAVITEFQEGYLPAYVGKAKLRIDSGTVYADLELLPRVADNSALHVLYPIPVLAVTERKGDVVQNCRIRYVGVSTSRNSDHRIESLHKQGVKP